MKLIAKKQTIISKNENIYYNIRQFNGLKLS